MINRIYTPESQQAVVPNSLLYFENNSNTPQTPTIISNNGDDNYEDIEDIELEEARPESLSLQNNEKDLIIKALENIKEDVTKRLMNLEFHNVRFTVK